MSQATLSNDPGATAAEPNEPKQFGYKPVPVIASVSAFFGIASVWAVLWEPAVLVTLIGIVLGGLSVWKIRKADGELGGRLWANIGLFGSLIFFFAGVTSHAYAYYTEVPEGYMRVSFPRDISARQFVIVNGVRELHPEVEKLEGKKIFLKGWMYNTQKQTGLTGFTLLKDNGKCCFGGSPKPYDMILIKMADGKTVNRIDGLVSVAGVLRCDPSAPPGSAVYTIEATYVDQARTIH